MAVALGLTGRTTAAVVLLAVVVTLAIASAASARFAHGMGRVLAAVGHAAGRALAWLLLGLVTLLLIVPVWAVGRLGRWDVLQHGRGPSGSWDRRSRFRWDHRADRPFATEPSRTRAVRLHGAALIVIPVLVLLAVAVPARHWVRDQRTGDDGTAASAATPSGAGEGEAPGTSTATWIVSGSPPQRDGDPLLTDTRPWADDVLRSRFQIAEYDPTNLRRIRDEDTAYFHYHDRVRASWTPPSTDGAFDVWFFGSSQLLGVSVVRDDFTIPSELAKLAWARDGVAVRASNFAVDGYQTWQQLVLLEQMLSERAAPDLVVFYGGYNDIHSTVFPGSPTEVTNTWAQDFARLLDEGGASLLPPSGGEVPVTDGYSPENAAALYDRGITITEQLLGALDIPFVHYLQPCLWTRGRPEDAQTLAGIGSDQAWADSFGAVYDAARAAIRSDVVDLSDALDDLPGVVYWDEAHHNEAGNAAVADAAYPTFRAELLALDPAA